MKRLEGAIERILGRGARRRALAAVLVVATTASAVVAASRAPSATAEAIVTELSREKESLSIAKGAIDATKKALERARAARDADDREHAALLEKLALEWAELGRDSVRAASAEAAALALETELAEIETRTVRARALLEETIARRDRARARLSELEGAKGATAPAPSAVPAQPKAKP